VSNQSLRRLLTKDERDAFNREGFLVVPGALERDHVDQLVAALDPIEATYRQESGLKPYQELNRLDAIGEDDSLLNDGELPTGHVSNWNTRVFT
jgi:hypothetical protein